MITAATQFFIPKVMPPGEVMLLVDLAPLDKQSVETVERIARGMGYSPELRLAEYVHSGKVVVEPVMLLYHATADQTINRTELARNWEYLAREITPGTSVHLREGA